MVNFTGLYNIPLADENHKQLYVVLVIEEDGRPTADIQALN